MNENYVLRLFGGKTRDWPHPQQMPSGSILYFVYQRLNPLISSSIQLLKRDKEAQRKLRMLRKLRGSESGSVFLLGNGPSGRDISASQLIALQRRGVKIAAMNRFYRLELSAQIVPDYYFVIDPLFWRNGEPINLELGSYLARTPGTTVVQPARFPQLGSGRALFVETLKNSGFRRNMDPTKLGFFPESVTLTAIMTLRWLGYSPILFAGLDSNVYQYYFVDELNRLNINWDVIHSYSATNESQRRVNDDSETWNVSAETPLRGMQDVFYSHAVFFRDMATICGDDCVNVGLSDTSNDVAPRASLWV